MTPSSDDIRASFIEFFRRHAHTHVPSSPCVPHNDPTLLFTNAGMNQFKPIFLGQADPAGPLAGLKRAANSQKCIRAGGKHNDLEDVGKDTYHHTFFEMLGNWSFGDYFKKEAIAWAFELLTKVYHIPANRLYATYFKGDPASGLAPDTEARDLWLALLPPAHVLPGSMKDNFWEMGDTGPCGPCSEIHFDRVGDRDASRLVNTGDPDVLEVWNLVFIQFNREAAPHPPAPGGGVGRGAAEAGGGTPGTLRPLPARHVDTGMGFERLTSILQNVRSNYDTDIFAPYFTAIERMTHGRHQYEGRVGRHDPNHIDTAFRVIADHIRTLTFALTDGAVPSNDGRGYVLRRILRRAVRFGREILGLQTGFFADLVPVVVERMGAAFPELHRAPDAVRAIIREEEEAFGKTLDRGLKLFEEAAERATAGPPARAGTPGTPGPAFGGTIPAEDAFRLYDTFGFPLDLTQLMAAERGLAVDTDGYERLMEEARQRSRAAGKEAEEHPSLHFPPDAIARLLAQGVKPTADADKFHGREISAHVEAIWNGHTFDEHARTLGVNPRPIGLVLDKTCFYAESGGQEADHGVLRVTSEARSSARDAHDGGEFRVEHTLAAGGYVLHVGRVVRGELRVGDRVLCAIDETRRQPIRANHTATHLLNLALRKALGAHVNQKGSLVAPDRLRFDFSHTGPLTPEQTAAVEKSVASMIARDLEVYADVAPLAQAKRIRGVRAVFGETYPDPVRVVSIGQPVADLLADPEHPAWEEVSVEFCGGTHLATTRQAGAFALTAETGIAKGVRRIEAITGPAAAAAAESARRIHARIAAAGALDGEGLLREIPEISALIEQTTLSIVARQQLRAALAPLQERLKTEKKAGAAARAAEVVSIARRLAEGALTANEDLIVATIDAGDDRQALQQALTAIQNKCPRAAVMLLSTTDDQVAIIAGVSRAWIMRGLKAGDWVRETAAIVGGKGGGKPEVAQGGGGDVTKVREAIGAARAFAHAKAG